MNKTIIVVIIAILVLGGVWYFTSNNESESEVFNQENVSTLNNENESQETADKPQPTSETEDTTTPSNNEEKSAEEVVVTYSEDGYRPTEVLISPGTTVIFKNEGLTPMWTASDPHPVHTGFSAFDSLKNVASGGTYSFTFESAGTYPYHNHSRASHGGQVIVE